MGGPANHYATINGDSTTGLGGTKTNLNQSVVIASSEKQNMGNMLVGKNGGKNPLNDSVVINGAASNSNKKESSSVANGPPAHYNN